MSNKAYSNFWWADNHLSPEHDGYEAVIKVSPPQVFIRFKSNESLVDFEDFFKTVAEVSWFGKIPPEKEVRQILYDAWNYLALEERILDNFEEQV